MPIYEYECDECNNRIEVMQKVSDPPLTECRACRGPLRKIVSPAGLLFKGSGWYVTDYARKNGAPPTGEKGADKGEKKEKAPAAKKPDSPKPTKSSTD